MQCLKCFRLQGMDFLKVMSKSKFLEIRPRFIFEHLARNPRFDNVTRRPGYSRGPSGFLPVSIEGMSFFIGLFLKEKGTFGFLGAESAQKAQKVKRTFFRENEPLK